MYKKKDVPIPPEKLKEIIGKADRANRKLFDGIDMRMPMDISVKTVQTTNGHAVVVTDKLERQMLKEKYGKRKDIKLVESQPVSEERVRRNIRRYTVAEQEERNVQI